MQNELIKASLDPACIRLELKAKTRDEAIRELVWLIHAKHNLRSPEQVLNVVMERERMMTTSLENGIAIPHGTTDIVDKVLVAVGIKKSGIDFNSSDGQPSNIIILMVSPAAISGPHMRCLAEISRLLTSGKNRMKLIEAKDAETVYRIMTEPGV